MKKKIDWFGKILFSVLGIGLAVFLLKQIDIKSLFSLLKQISPTVFAAFGVYLISYVLRSFRWRLMLFSRKIGIGTLFLVTSMHTMFNNLLPARTGEMTYVYFLKKLQKVPSTEGLATLFLARIFDLVAMAVFFLVAVCVNWGEVQIPVLKLVLVTVFSVPVLVFVLMGLLSMKSVRVLRSWLEKTRFGKTGIGQKLIMKLEELAEAVKTVRTRHTFLSSFFCTLCIWGTKFSAFYLIIRSFNLPRPLRFWEVVFGSTFSELTTILPFHGIAGIGTLEAGWTLGFLTLGIDKQTVITTAFGFHILLHLFSIVLGLGCLAAVQVLRKTGKLD